MSQSGKYIVGGGGGSNVQTLTGNTGGAVGPTSNNINTPGAHGLNSVGDPGTSTMTFAIDNAITLGDLDNIIYGDPALTIATGDIKFTATNGVGNLDMAQGLVGNYSQGYIYFGNLPTIFAISDDNESSIFVGQFSGSSISGAIATSAGNNNSALGALSLANLGNSVETGGSNNTSVGYETLYKLTQSSNNTAIGYFALNELEFGTTSAGYNTACGADAIKSLTGGAYNSAFGYEAGSNWTDMAESSNIAIGNSGTNGDQNIIRIGTQGSGDAEQNACYIAGIYGVTVASSVPVLVGSDGQLGTVLSAIRYKENIQNILHKSDGIFDLRPVIFNYKEKDPNPHFGLIAEEVAEVYPELVLFVDDQPESVFYHELPILLLNELKKMKEEIQELKKQYEELKCHKVVVT